MGSADRVHVELFHENEIVFHVRKGNRRPLPGMKIVAVDAAQLDRPAVEEEFPLPHFGRADARLFEDALSRAVDRQIVKEGGLRAPEFATPPRPEGSQPGRRRRRQRSRGSP